MKFTTDFGTGNRSWDLVEWHEAEWEDFDAVCAYAESEGIQDFSRHSLYVLVGEAVDNGRDWGDGESHGILAEMMEAIADKATWKVAKLLHTYCSKW